MQGAKQHSRSLMVSASLALGAVLCLLMGLGIGGGIQQANLRLRMEETLDEQLPSQGRVESYATSETCLSCHPNEHASWAETYHRTMTQRALPENVMGQFDGQTILSDGLAYTVTETNGTYWARMPDPDLLMQAVQGGRGGDLTKIPMVDRQVVLATGSHHYQTYWVESPRMDTLLQTLPLVYLRKDQRWIPREAAFMRGPDDRERMVTQWNHHCIRCHSTGWNPGLNETTGMLETEVSEMGISCEACHGPGEAHIAYHRNPWHRYRSHLGDQEDTTIVNPAKLDHERSSHVCGQCHGVFIPRSEMGMKIAKEGLPYKPGDNLFDTRYYIHYPVEGDPPERWEELKKNPQFFRERWWEDGTILAGGREFTAMASSDCYLSGKMSCLSCHAMHDAPPEDQLKRGMDSSHACIQCHDTPQYTERLEEHTFHGKDSSGSDCMNCHMPRTTYALFNAIRTHEVRSPDLKASAEHGVPNACNLCHLDKSLEWTQNALVERYGTEPVPLSEEQRSLSAAMLWMIKGHAAQRAIVAWHFGWQAARDTAGSDWMPPILSPLLMDPYPVVRYIAHRSLRSVHAEWPQSYDFLAPGSEHLKAYRSFLSQWEMGATEVVFDPALLGDAEGRLQSRLLRRLLRQRDDRSVTIKE